MLVSEYAHEQILAGKWNHVDTVVPPAWSKYFWIEKPFSPPPFLNAVTKLGFGQFFLSELVLRAALSMSQWH